MAPAFLIVGATGNTGVGVVHTLSSLLEKSKTYSNYDIIALTRSASSETAKKLAKLPKVQVKEKNWVEIRDEWLQEHNVQRVFIASHNGATHFTDESLFLNYAKQAKVEYVVRISTTASNIAPDTPVFYARNHWAVETMLSQPEFDSMKWTSLRPNVFISVLEPVLQGWLKKYRETGKKGPLNIMLDGDHPVAIVDSYEVGVIAGHLLASEDASVHASKKYIIVGPQDATGKEMVKILEKHAKTTVDEVNYRDVSWLEQLKGTGYPEYLLPSLSTAPRSSFEGACSLKGSPTSPEVMKLYAPKNGVLDALDAALAQM